MTLLSKNFILDDADGKGHILIRDIEVDSTTVNSELVDRQLAKVTKNGVSYLFVGDGDSALSAMQPISARKIEGWTADVNGLTATSSSGKYKIDGTGNGLEIECDASKIVLSNQQISITADTINVEGSIATLDVSGATELNGTLSVAGTSTFTGKITANGGVAADNLTVTNASTFSGNITVNGSATVASLSSSGNVTGKIGTITSTEWSTILATDLISTGFAKANHAIGTLFGRIENIGNLQTGITGKTDFGGTGETVNSINSLINVLHGIFTGEYIVSGRLQSEGGFWAKEN